MRASEFVNEGKVVDKGKLDGTAGAAIPSAQSYPEILGHYYDMYRFGIAAAMAPADDHHDFARQSVGPEMFTIQYTDGEREILDKAHKIMGVHPKKHTSQKSEEINHVHSVSPVAKPKRNKYGV
jgi:hypothetical protein